MFHQHIPCIPMIKAHGLRRLCQAKINEIENDNWKNGMAFDGPAQMRET